MNKFKKIVQWSEEDDCFIGSCPGVFYGGACHGDDEIEVFKELSALVDDTIHNDLTASELQDPTPYFFDVERDRKKRIKLSTQDYAGFKELLEKAHDDNPNLMKTLSFDKSWEEILNPVKDGR